MHVALALINLHADALNPIGDVRVVYRGWAEDALAGNVVGVDGPFVYPIVALLPILVASGLGAGAYAETWMLLVLLLDAAALWVLIGPPWGGGGRVPARRLEAAAWWVLFLAALGPVAIGRIDAVTVPVAVVALVLAARRPVMAASLLTFATWIKVWPAALLAAMLVTLRARGRVLAVAVAGSAAIVSAALLAGSGGNVFSFLGQQTGRGLQIEAPVSTFWMWQASTGGGGASVYYDRDILTFQVTGEGTALASALSTPAIVIAALAVVAFGVRATRRGVSASQLLPVLALGLVLALIVFNKVGSPQFLCWLAAPVILGIVSAGPRYRTPVVLVLVLAALTQLVYPWLYSGLLAVDPGVLLVLAGRNVLLVALFVWCVVRLWKAGSPGGLDGRHCVRKEV